MLLRPLLLGGQQVFAAVFHPLHRPLQQPRGDRHRRLFGIEAVFDPEAPADVRRDHPHGVQRQLEQGGEKAAGGVGGLGDIPQGEGGAQLAGLPHRQAAARLQRLAADAAEAEGGLHHPRGLGEGGGEVAEAVAEGGGAVVGQGGVQPRGGRGGGLGGGGQRGEGVVGDVDGGEGVFGAVGVGGDDEGDGLADEADGVGGAGAGGGAAAGGAGDEEGDGRSVGGEVGGAGAGGGVGGGEEGGEELGGEVEVGEEGGGAAEEAGVFAAREGGA